jgi:hypothetical protein
MTAAVESNDRLKDFSVYQEYLAERDEILKHKWIQSQKAGHDLGFEWALTDWVVKYRTGWRKWRKSLRNASN